MKTPLKTSSRRSTSARRARSASHVRSKATLGRYLAAGLGATVLATVECEAGVVNIDVTSLGLTTGANAGVPSGGDVLVNNFLGLTGREFDVTNNFYQPGYPYGLGFTGFRPQVGTRFATGFTTASPTKFVEGSSVGSSANFSGDSSNSVFAFSIGQTYRSDDFTLIPANFIGFRVAANGTAPLFNDATQFHYGYFRVTWNKQSDEFRILSGAYESTVNTPITIVPEPTSAALAGIGALALGAGAIRRSRKARQAAAKSTLAEAV